MHIVWEEETVKAKTVETISHNIPAEWKVCYRCDGEGKIVNPSIDDHGISAQEFAEDPDFEESYFRGDYDIVCTACKGRTTAKVIDWDAFEATMPDVAARYTMYLDREDEYGREREWEMRNGY